MGKTKEIQATAERELDLLKYQRLAEVISRMGHAEYGYPAFIVKLLYTTDSWDKRDFGVEVLPNDGLHRNFAAGQILEVFAAIDKEDSSLKERVQIDANDGHVRMRF